MIVDRFQHILADLAGDAIGEQYLFLRVGKHAAAIRLGLQGVVGLCL
jgi:hypothetical protein